MKPGPYAIRGLLGVAVIVAVAIALVRVNAGNDLALAANRVDATAILAGRTQRISSTRFEGGQTLALLGGVELDLRNATIEDDEAVIDLLVMFGGLEIRVPEDWVVIDEVATAVGGMENRTRSLQEPGSKRLVVRGTVLFGGLDIRN
jgi:predicted membrane protein